MSTRKHEEIAESLTRDILVGQYRTGERLPSERDLAARFDANRGAVREAMKKLEQLGLATVQPGGARVVPLHEASLDVIGHLLALGELPDADLVDQILQVMQSLITLAAECAVRRASDEEMAVIRSRVRALLHSDHDRPSHTHARFELMSAIMEASGNLVCRLIARSLLLQFAPRVAALDGYVELNLEAHRAYAQRLDAALAARDVESVRATFEALSNFNREAARQAFDAIERGVSPSAKVAAS
jgi:GntR family transcriptional regulator, transcriptional repressor for pyruvate dehydrogenase complex